MSASSRRVALTTPSERPGERARALWRTNAVLLWLLIGGLLAAFAYYVHWALPLQVLAGALAVVAALDILVAPHVRYRVHRYQVGEQTVISRSGWWFVQHRIAPISRIQTVDVHQGLTARYFGLSTVVVSTASSAGALRIVALETNAAEELAADLLHRTGRDGAVDGR